ncbi:MAG TPA: HAMP domain-containing sensor histidine kinase [Chitinophagaceae bacterium]|jgi:signal transduction histidine kinase|nr:HAMP domain-containing sensor histidine kinase [Chitinophagaceae bacterium]
MKSRFVSMASHEFRAPLSTVLSSIGLIEQYIGKEQIDKKHKHVERIRSAVKNMRVILDDFLSLDKLDQGKVAVQLHTFSLHELVLDIISDFDGALKPEQEIRYDHKGGERIVLDKQILHNILINLISNANKYSDQDIQVSSEVNAGQVIITVQDKGIGIPQEEQQQLFEKFFRASNTSYVQGTGLGLTIVKRYTDLLNGSVDFISRQNEGTIFTLRFPVFKMEEI